MDNHELYHYGIKGQRWGIRRFQKKNGSLTPAGKKRQKEKWSEDATEASKIKKKSVKEMSNAELKRLNERTRLEQEYSRLNPSNSKKALAAVTATAATMGTLLNLYNNSDKIIAKGKPIVSKLLGPAARKAKDAMAIGLWSDIHSDELYHYGVKGMKWGVRRAQKKELYKEVKQARSKAHEEEFKRLDKKYGASKKYHAAYEYARKYNLAMDDGGGGTGKQGDIYLKLAKDADEAYTKADDGAAKYARKHVVEKYGEQTVKSIERQDNAYAAAVVSLYLGVPLALIVGSALR